MRTMIKISLASALFAVVHSLLASLPVKRAVGLRVGPGRRNAYYRMFFIAQSLFTFSLLGAYGLRQPARVLYRLTGLPALAARLGQLAGLAYAVYATYHAGFWQMSGLANWLAWFQRQPQPEGPVDSPEGPVAQGPERRPDGSLPIRGPFRLSRHPLNLSPLPIFWLEPVMTTRRLAFNLVSTVYLILGSIHEEQRLRQVYGDSYAAYQRSGVPFFWPRSLHGLFGLPPDGQVPFAAEVEAGRASR